MSLQSALLALLLTALSLTPETEGLNVTVVSPSKMPSFITRCSIKDPQLRECMIREGNKVIPIIIKGVPEMHVPCLDPLEIDEILIETGRRPTIFRMLAKDIVLTGLTQSSLQSINPDFKNQEYTADVHIPNLVIKGDYEVDGQILLLPITGKGKFTFTFKNSTLTYKVTYTLRERSKGKVYHENLVSRADFATDFAHFEMGNLYNGDKILSDQIHTFVNENWRDVISELGQPFVDAAVQIIHLFAKKLSKSISYEELYDDVDSSILEQMLKVNT